MRYLGAVQHLNSGYVITFEGYNNEVTNTKFYPRKGLIFAIVDFFY